ncbi:hypothetical protein EMGBD3_14630 [Nitrosarchaeum sp.]|nr:hypothetical protein EMGBD3_14630 [Nitrosarchaeum sp.]
MSVWKVTITIQACSDVEDKLPGEIILIQKGP